jgi:long-chain acyl-CoA synthetase
MLFFAPRHVVVTTVHALNTGTQPIEIGKRGIAPLIAGFAGRARPVRRAADDTVAIVHTPGATDSSKVTDLTHGDIVNQAATARGLLSLGPDDVVMGCQPLFEAFGITCALTPALVTGATLVLLPRLDPRRAPETISAEQVTVFEGVPSMYAAMLGVADRDELGFSALRVCMSAVHRCRWRFCAESKRDSAASCWSWTDRAIAIS